MGHIKKSVKCCFPCLSYDTKLYIYIYIYEAQLKKENDPKFEEFIIKVEGERFGYNNLLQDFRFMKNVVKIAMDV